MQCMEEEILYAMKTGRECIKKERGETVLKGSGESVWKGIREQVRKGREIAVDGKRECV